jgi:glutaredoxin
MKYTIFFLDTCPYSHAAKDILDSNNIKYDIFTFSQNLDEESTREVYVNSLNKKYKVDGEDRFEKQLFKDKFGKDETFPRVYEEEKLIGGYSDLEKKLTK